MKTEKPTTLNLKKTIGRSRLRLAFLLIPLVLACFALCQQVRAQETPDPGSVGGSLNTADGTNALGSVTTGAANSAFGWFSLRSDTEGSFNTAVGAGALLFNTADQNTAVGAAALLSNTTGTLNTAFGDTALLSNTTGDRNTVLGSRALNANTTGHFNTGVGRSALLSNTTGNDNVAVGVDALQDNTTGANNVCVDIGEISDGSVSTQQWAKLDIGTLTITNKRLVFDGGNQDRTVPLNKVFSVDISPTEIIVSAEDRRKSMAFQVANPLIASSIVKLCCQVRSFEFFR